VKTPNKRQKGRQTGQAGGSGPLSEPAQIARVAALVAQRHHAGQSLRDLAKEIGVSKSAVDSLVKAHDGERRMPQPHVTSARLRTWYLAQRLASDGGLQEPVDMALVADRMLGDVPAADRPAATSQLLATVGGIYDRFATARPTWLRTLAQAAGPAELTSSPPSGSD
jgi:hypothetical protein